MSMIKKIIIRGLGGILIGVFISQIAYLIMALQSETVQLASDQIIQQFLFSMLVGFYTSAISVVFEVEQWSLMRQTITHAILMLPYFPIAYLAHWFPQPTYGKVLFVLEYILVYMIIWFSFRAYWKKRARELNQELQNYQSIEEE